MKPLFPVAIAAAALVLPLAAQAETAVTPIDLDAQARCAALFAIVANEQRRNAPGSEKFPPMAEQGREFFVQTGLRLMKERALGEDAIKPFFMELVGKIQKEYADSPDAGTRLDQEMGTCMAMKKTVEADVPKE
ncbi:MAG TPA: hypothetical protein DER67_02355 [Novosphingobium sp.]|nr:hypothetical protein [Novosphingobium sp.]